MLNDNFNPSNTAIMSERSLDKIGINILKKFNAVILTKSPNENDYAKLKMYVDNGGILLPNIFSGENQLSDSKINSILSSFNSSYSGIKKIGVQYGTSNRASLKLNGESGFLVLSEQYSQYSGWKAAINSEEVQIFNADNIISAVYVDNGSGTLTFEYKLNSFKDGAWISGISFLALIIFFSIKLFYRRNKSGAGL